MTWRRIAPWVILTILALAIVIDLPFNLLGDGVRTPSPSRLNGRSMTIASARIVRITHGAMRRQVMSSALSPFNGRRRTSGRRGTRVPDSNDAAPERRPRDYRFAAG